MKPKSLSASALQVAETCMARYYSENILRTERPANLAADLGTAVHGALEWYVKGVYVDKDKPESLMALLFLYRREFCQVFGTADPDQHPWFKEGEDMCKSWFARTDFSNRTVISCEVKTSFEVKTSIGPIPFNYIWDRFDKIEGKDDEYEVVDYKTIRANLNPADLRKKIQARFYGLAAQIQHPEAKRIWVRFDLLRHDSVATVFTREDNAATWKFAKALAEKIIAMPDPGSTLPDGSLAPWPESLNAECGFCVRKASCTALQSNITGGGIWSLDTTEKRVDARAALGFQLKAITGLINDLDEVILKEASEAEKLQFETELYRAKVVQGSRRQVDAERVQHVIGKEMFYKYGGIKLTMADFGKLVKDKDLTEEQKRQLNGLVYRAAGELKIAIESKNPIDEE